MSLTPTTIGTKRLRQRVAIPIIINNHKEVSMDNETNRKTIKVATNDYCTQCVWLDKQPEGNAMLCVLPGECFWLEGWRTPPKK